MHTQGRTLLRLYLVIYSLTALFAVYVAFTLLKTLIQQPLLALGILLWQVPIIFFIEVGLMQSVRWRLAAAHVSSETSLPVPIDQDEDVLPLEKGEVIHLERVIPNRGFKFIFARFPFSIIIVVMIWESIWLAGLRLLPIVDVLHFGTFIQHLNQLQILLLLLALAIVCLVPLPSILRSGYQRRLIIHADDQGLCIQQSGQPSVMFPWDAICYGYYFSDFHDYSLALSAGEGTYMLGSTNAMAIVRMLTFSTMYPVANFAYTPDKFTFLDDWRRILATIAARSTITVSVPATWLHAPKIQEADQPTTRLIPFPMQPRPDLMAAMQQAPTTVVLRSRLRYRALLVSSCWMAFLVSPILALWFGIEWYINAIAHQYDQFRMTFATPTATLDFCAAMVPCIAVVSLCMGWLMSRGNRVTITADPNGITDANRRRKGRSTVEWKRITHWFVAPITVGARTGMHYRLYRGGITPFLQWTEWPEDSLAEWSGSRRTFQERAEQLHALIAAKTGLPLLEDQYPPARKRALLYWLTS